MQTRIQQAAVLASRGTSEQAAHSPGFDDAVADSVREFSAIQGEAGWQYGYMHTQDLARDTPGGGAASSFRLFERYEKGWWRLSNLSTPAVSATMFESARDLAAARRWTPESGGSVRLVGRMEKQTAGVPALFLVLADGEEIWRYRFAATDTIPHAFDILALDLNESAAIDCILVPEGDEQAVQVAANVQIVSEPYASRWRPSLPPGFPVFSEAERRNLRQKGQDLLQEIRAASAADGVSRMTVPAGDYLFHANWSHASTLSNIENLEIDAEGVTFWFEPPMVHGLLFENCRNVTVRGLTIDFTLPPFTQARVTEIDRQRKSISAELMPGYQPRDEFGRLETKGERKLIFYDANGAFLNHRHTRSDWTLSDDGKRILYAKARVNPIPDALQVGDYVVSPIQTGTALRSVDCASMRYEDINIFSSPGMAVYEGGGEGGHRYTRVRATRRPHTNRLQAFGADVFHLAATDRGPLLDRCESAYAADDNVNIHGSFGRVVQKIDSQNYYLQGRYDVDDSIEFRDDKTLDLLGIGRVTSSVRTPDGPSTPINDRYSAKGEYLVELNKPFNLPELALVVMDGRMSSAGFVIRNSWFHDNFQRTLINGSPGGLIENTTLQNVGHGLCIQFETWGPWMEGPFPRDMVIRNNRFLAAPPAGPTITVSMHPVGGGSNARRFEARPITNLTISGNYFDGIDGTVLSIHNVDGLNIHRNSVTLSAGTSEWIEPQDCKDVSTEGNRVLRPDAQNNKDR